MLKSIKFSFLFFRNHISDDEFKKGIIVYYVIKLLDLNQFLIIDQILITYLALILLMVTLQYTVKTLDQYQMLR